MATLSDLSAYDLARLAGVASPDSDDSRGAAFLVGIRDAVADAWDNGEDLNPEGDTAHEVADGAVPVYTHPRWQAFVDLCAYTEDISDLAGGTGNVDLTECAGLALYLIAERLVTVLAEQLAEDQTE